ncbi:hypothetical protein GFS60_01130 [Rhodococcus sp. WAY2]|nr:hypothetical protein GFS60_01130 [Rhodococcus sp. WAY2]
MASCNACKIDNRTLSATVDGVRLGPPCDNTKSLFHQSTHAPRLSMLGDSVRASQAGWTDRIRTCVSLRIT